MKHWVQVRYWLVSAAAKHLRLYPIEEGNGVEPAAL
jgi:hypothetical protein